MVTLAYDDLAHHESNPLPGRVINRPGARALETARTAAAAAAAAAAAGGPALGRAPPQRPLPPLLPPPPDPLPALLLPFPGGPDVYAGVAIDYRGADVTAETFLAVLTGDARAVAKKGTGRVLEAGPNDKVRGGSRGGARVRPTHTSPPTHPVGVGVGVRGGRRGELLSSAPASGTPTPGQARSSPFSTASARPHPASRPQNAPLTPPPPHPPQVFLFYSDHGAAGVLGMPEGPFLYADQLHNALRRRARAGGFREMVM
jgi:hypothetical protein